MLPPDDYLNGQLGAWSPRQPQWQHWGALWLTKVVHGAGAALCIATGVVIGGWLDASWVRVEQHAGEDEQATAWVYMLVVVEGMRRRRRRWRRLGGAAGDEESGGGGGRRI